MYKHLLACLLYFFFTLTPLNRQRHANDSLREGAVLNGVTNANVDVIYEKNLARPICLAPNNTHMPFSVFVVGLS